ncbi:MAG TPA: VOC family protein [Burkholderiaceae bacterium]|nr:VOC family protein [Burkholderiaceae bacterium]
MAIQLNHTIVAARDPESSARLLSQLLGLAEPVRYGPFFGVVLDNGVTLDYMESAEPITSQHYAFIVEESEFDEIFERIRDRGFEYWADPGHRQAGTINHRDGGRGVYWKDPDGHNLEILTREYGSGAKGPGSGPQR